MSCDRCQLKWELGDWRDTRTTCPLCDAEKVRYERAELYGLLRRAVDAKSIGGILDRAQQAVGYFDFWEMTEDISRCRVTVPGGFGEA